MTKYAAAHPELAATYTRQQSGALPATWKKDLPEYKFGESATKATRQ